MSRRGTRANLRDIADAAGVSMQTASRVVRGVDVVAEATRERVLQVVKELNYQPNLAARSLSARRTGTVHVLDAVPLFHGHATSFVEICQRLSDAGLHISVTVLRGDDFDSLELADLVPVGADGVIILGGMAEPNGWVSKIAAAVPTVYVGQAHDLPTTVAGVAVDHKEGAKAAVAHLLERGARSLAHVAGPQDWVDARLRLQGFEAACAAAGVQGVILHADSWEAEAAVRVLDHLPEGVDGLFAANDELALGCLKALPAKGLTVPDDVRVVGFDDAPGVESLRPGLTTLRQNFRAVGELAVESLTGLLGGDSPARHLIETTLVVREST